MPEPSPDRRPLTRFLTQRLHEELAALWERDGVRDPVGRPGLAAQVAVLDELLVALDAGVLPDERDLRILLFGYGGHPEYDPSWSTLNENGSHSPSGVCRARGVRD